MKKILEEKKSEDSGFNLLEYWRIAWRKKHFILVPIIVAAAVSLVGIRFLVPVYVSSSVIRMEEKRFLSREVERYVRLEEKKMLDKATLARVRAELESSAFLDELIHDLGTQRNPELIKRAWMEKQSKFPEISIEELILRKLRKHMRKQIEVDKAGPGMFKLSCFDYDPESCYRLAEAVTNLFIERQKKRQIKGLQEASEFSDEQLAVYMERLEKSERELERVKRLLSKKKIETNPVAENNIRYSETLLKQLGIREKDKEDVVSRIRSNLIALFGALPSSERIWSDQGFRKLEDKLVAQSETQLLIDLASRGEQSAESRKNQKDIRQTEEELQRHLVNLVQISYQDISEDYRPLVAEYYFQLSLLESERARHKRLKSYIESFRRRIEIAPAMEREYERLQEEVEINRALYNSFLKAKTTAQISEAVQNTNLGLTIEIVEKAEKPLKPVRPNKPKIIIIALLFGGVLGIGVLFISEYSDTSFRSVDEIEESLGIRVLGAIPRFDIDTGWNRHQKKRAAMWVAASIIAVVVSILGFYYYGKSVQKQSFEIYTSSSQM